jgi:hypothetical protein
MTAEGTTTQAGARKRIETIYWAGVFIWAGFVFGADHLDLLPQIGESSAWSWVFAGAGLLALLGNIYRAVSPDWQRMPAHTKATGWDWVWAVALLVIGLSGFFGLEIAFPLVLVVIGVITVVGVILRRD